jgi:hypothetical protein
MRLSIGTIILAALAMLAVSPSANAQSVYRPYDPYPWCAVYGRDGPRNCGFLTLAQCMLTTSGAGASCEPNLFYNPGKSSKRHRR